MAAYVKGRFHAARVGVTMAILGLLAGLGIKNEGGTRTTIIADPAAAQLLVKNSVGSAQIKNHSLLFNDLKIHQVPSYKQYDKFTKADNIKWVKLDSGNVVHKVDVFDKQSADGRFLKLDDAAGYLKIDSANLTFLKLDDANANFLHKADTASNALKIDGLSSDQIIQGRGQVITGNTVIGASDSDIFILIGLLKVSVKNTAGAPSSDVTLTNLSTTETLLFNGDGKGQTLTIPPGGNQTSSFGDGSVHTFQVVVQGGTTAITIGLSSFTGGVHTMVGQAVVGSY